MTAPYDFQIYKDGQAVGRMKDGLRYRILSLTCYWTQAVLRKTGLFLKADYQSKYKFTLPSHYYTYLTTWFSNVYASGIIGKKDKDKLLKDSVTVCYYCQ